MKSAAYKSRITTERREKLILGAIRSIAAGGYNEATVVSICDEAGLSRGLIGYYFKGKDELLIEAYRYLVEQEEEEGRQGVEAAGDDPLEQLLAISRTFFLRAMREKEASLVMIASRGVAPWHGEMLALTRRLWREYRAWIRELIAAAAAARNLEVDARIGAITFAQLNDGLWMGWILDPEAYTLDDAEVVVRQWLFSYLGEPRPTSLQA
jgi:TetR/AcrR family transcriptional repressor of bet genes